MLPLNASLSFFLKFNAAHQTAWTLLICMEWKEGGKSLEQFMKLTNFFISDLVKGLIIQADYKKNNASREIHKLNQQGITQRSTMQWVQIAP